MGSIWKTVTAFFKPKQKMEDDTNKTQTRVEEVDDNEDSDSDDEDFVPNEANDGALSEELSDGDDEDGDESKKKTDKKNGKGRKRKAQKKKPVNGRESKRGKFANSNDSDDGGDVNFTIKESSKTDHDSVADDVPNAAEEASQEAQEKAETDRLWADFLTSVNEEKAKKDKKDVTVDKVVSKVYDFAGEKVVVQEKVKVTVSSTSSEEAPVNKSNGTPSGSGNSNNSASTSEMSHIFAKPGPSKRSEEPIPGTSASMRNDTKTLPEKPRRRGGISILGNDPETIGLDELDKRGLSGLLKAFKTKSKSIGTLEKSKLDWETYKRQEGLEDELQTHNKSRDTYIDKQEFLQRTDYRQFEVEKNMRATARSRRLAN